jgi:hypothetical protein
MRKGLVEWLLVTAFLALAAAGAVALFGDELRAALGVSRPAPVQVKPAPQPEGEARPAGDPRR